MKLVRLVPMELAVFVFGLLSGFLVFCLVHAMVGCGDRTTVPVAYSDRHITNGASLYVPIEKVATQSIDALKEHYENILSAAELNPTSENISACLAQEQAIMIRAEAFSEMAKRVFSNHSVPQSKEQIYKLALKVLAPKLADKIEHIQAMALKDLAPEMAEKLERF